MRFSEAVALFMQHLATLNRSKMTMAAYSQDLRDFEAFLAAEFNCPVYLEDVTSGDVDRYLHRMLERKLASATRQRGLVAIKSFFAFCFRKRLVADDVANGLDNVRVERKERAFLTHAEALQLFGAVDRPIVRVFAQVLYYSGLRLSEGLGLTVDDVDLGRGVIRVLQGKGKKDRVVPISKALRPIIEEYLAWRPRLGTRAFFVSKSGGLSQSYVDATLKRAAQSLGWSRTVSPHMLRHSFASNLVRQNVNVVHISRLLGHSSLNTTSIYTHTDLDELAKAVNTM